MAVIKKIDDKDRILANKSIVSHDQLTNRDAYGAHPISAIRKLPEKLSALKKNIEEIEDQIENHNTAADIKIKELEQKDVDLNSKIDNVEKNAQGILLSENTEEAGTLVFTDYNGNNKVVRSGYLPDNDTLELTDDNLLALKKVYVDNTTIVNSGTASDPLEIKNKPDELTIITDEKNSQIYSGAIKDEKGVITPQNIRDEIAQNTETHDWFESEFNKVDSKLKYINEVDNNQQDQINDLFTRTKGSGGYLNAYNFGKNPTQEDLTNYALQDIGIEDKNKIFNGTKVRNLYDNHIWILTNTPDSDPPVFSWEDQGVDAVISDANNDGVHGLVTGSYEDFRGGIDALGRIYINGLEDELTNIKTDITTKSTNLNTKIDTEISDREKAVSDLNDLLDGKIVDLTDTLNQFKEDTNTSITNINTSISDTKEELEEKIELANGKSVKYKYNYTNDTEYSEFDIVKYGNYFYISTANDNTQKPTNGPWINLSAYAANAQKIQINSATDKLYLIGNNLDTVNENQLLYKNTEIYVEDDMLHDSRGKVASQSDLDDTKTELQNDLSTKVSEFNSAIDDINESINNTNSNLSNETTNRQNAIEELEKKIEAVASNASMSFVIRRWAE